MYIHFVILYVSMFSYIYVYLHINPNYVDMSLQACLWLCAQKDTSGDLAHVFS